MSKYVVLDFEMCRVPRAKRESYNWKSELIEIGAVVVDESFEIQKEFMTYVSPTFGKVDSYIETLTGISQKNVENAPDLKKALELLINWLPDDAILISWSDNDEKQLRNEMDAKGIYVEELVPYLDNWLDCQKTFSEKMDTEKIYKLSEALNICDINYNNGEHDALIDAKNTALLFIKMQREPKLVLNPYYTNDSQGLTFNPFAALLKNYNFAS